VADRKVGRILGTPYQMDNQAALSVKLQPEVSPVVIRGMEEHLGLDFSLVLATLFQAAVQAVLQMVTLVHFPDREARAAMVMTYLHF
jgi:heme/copper-type cytochrome/quinol oxidase subunit 4